MKQELRFMLFITENDDHENEYIVAVDENAVDANETFESYTKMFSIRRRVRVLICEERPTLEAVDKSKEKEYFEIGQQFRIPHHATPSILISEFGWPTMRHPQTCRLMDTRPNLSAREQLEEENFVEHLLREKKIISNGKGAEST